MAVYMRFCECESVPLLSANVDDVRLFVADQLEHHARATAMNRLLAVRSFFRYLVARDVRPDDPTAAIPIRRDVLEPQRPYTVGELRRLLAATESLVEKAMLLFAIGSGARRSEMMAVDLADVDWIDGTVLLRRAKGGRERKVAPGREAMKALCRYVEGRCSGPVWVTECGRQMGGQDAYRMLQRIARRAGVVGATMHRIRVTMICGLLEAGADAISVSVVAGHSLEMVQHYQRATESKRALAVQARLSLADRL